VKLPVRGLRAMVTLSDPSLWDERRKLERGPKACYCQTSPGGARSKWGVYNAEARASCYDDSLGRFVSGDPISAREIRIAGAATGRREECLEAVDPILEAE
jgi:hypothetical protein